MYYSLITDRPITFPVDEDGDGKGHSQIEIRTTRFSLTSYSVWFNI